MFCRSAHYQTGIYSVKFIIICHIYYDAMTPDRNPFDRFDRIRRMIRNLSEGSVGGQSMINTYVDQSVDEENGVLTVVMDIPGVSEEDIEAKVQEHRNRQWLTVQATRSTENGARRFRQQFALKRRVDAELADSEYNNGVLTVEFPLVEASGDEGVEIDI